MPGGIATIAGNAGPNAPAAEAPDASADSSARTALLAVFAVAVVVVVDAAGKSFDTDAGWHIASGRWMLDEGRLPRRDPFSWSALGEPWRLNSWLFDLVVGALDRLGGPGAVSTLMLAAVFAFPFAVFAVARRIGATPAAGGLAAATAAYLAAPMRAERPQVVSFLLFPMAWLLVTSALRGRQRSLVALGALFVIWSNFHLTFSAGVLLVLLVAAADALAHRRIVRPVLVVAVVGTAGLVNPYGWGAYAASLDVRTKSQGVEIQEWGHVDLSDFTQAMATLVLLAALMSVARTGRWRRLDVVVPLVVFGALAMDARRHLPFMLVLAAPEMALGLSTNLPPTLRRYLRSRRRPLMIGLVAGTIVAAVSLLPPDLRPRSEFPVRGIAAIPTGCRLLNEYVHGGLILERRWPEVAVSMDGRNDMYGDARVIEQTQVLNAERDWDAWLDANHVDCLLAEPERAIVTALERAGWNVATREQAGVLLLRP